VIDEAVLPLVVEAARDSANPVRRIPGHLGRYIRGMPLREQPEDVPMAALGALAGATVAAFQLVHAQFRRKLDVSWHDPFYNGSTLIGMSSSRQSSKSSSRRLRSGYANR
jgi:hypothetical protein